MQNPERETWLGALGRGRCEAGRGRSEGDCGEPATGRAGGICGDRGGGRGGALGVVCVARQEARAWGGKLRGCLGFRPLPVKWAKPAILT